MNEIIISTSHIVPFEQQASACCSGHFYAGIISGTVGVAEFHPLALHGLALAPLDRCLPRDESAT